MNTTHINEWQKLDPTTGLIMPWFTHDFLDRIADMDLSKLRAIEFGAGMSTAYWRARFAHVDSIEANIEWAEAARLLCNDHGLMNGRVFAENLREGTPEDLPPYVNMIPEDDYDVWIIDGIFRTEMVEMAIARNARLLFIDNLDQDQVWISPRAMEAIAPYREEVYIQKDHTNHEGKPWNSRIVFVAEALSWESFTDYDSHRPLLARCLDLTKGPVIELGAGWGSTLLLEKYCKGKCRPFFSGDTNGEWARRFAATTKITSYHNLVPINGVLLFIDSNPGEDRAKLIERWANFAHVIIVHDTEPSAEYVYHMSAALSQFRYRIDHQTPGFPMTTAVSNHVRL